ncbi:ABC transporter substrate-binding protein [Oryzibacter oryziterrae]|uniref:ABC transporter substrate-binding protein n=1 Tax=Oryzibacter oryziterrae TaxID=2766474 RepID=UPI001F386929|nr:ABC transporter substrate-binding protein [Oryzibacter oryziterrae]
MVWGSDAIAADNTAPQQKIRIGYIQWGKPRETLSFPESPTADRGLAGARLAIADNNTTGKFTRQQFELVERKVNSVDEGVQAYDALVADGVTLVIADLPAEGILKLADDKPSATTLIFNIAAKEDSLREENCRADVVHVVPSYTMLADGLAQYLVWKRWPHWFLLTGALPTDRIWADALKRAAGRFGAEIVEERTYSETDTSARTDSGQAQVQRQMPVFTQNAPDHDVVVVADVNEIFAAYVPYRTWDPKPVAGSAGLMPTEWSPTHEQWGGFQTQNRFYDMNHRWMRDIDADAWTAVRMIGEAATRTKSADAATIRAYVTGPKMEVAAYKGQKLTLRSWNQQLRQPILLTDGRTIVSVSPQEGFLHERSELDTMGIDEPETACKLK